MKILNEREQENSVGWWNPGGNTIWTTELYVQQVAIPTTPEETSFLTAGRCPKCGDELAGDNGLFCVRDQTWWEMPTSSAGYKLPDGSESILPMQKPTKKN